MLVGDVNLLKKVFDFLEFWGLINYHVSSENKQQQTTTTDEKSPEKEMITESTDIAGPGNNTVTLEASPQFVSTSVVSSCQAGESSSQMPLQPLDTDQSENVPSQTDEHTTAAAAVPIEAGSKVQLPHSADWLGNWTIQEVLRLLEAIGKFGEDWNRVAAHVGTKSKLDCVLKFIKLPFGDQFNSNIGVPHYSTSNGGAMEEEIPRIKGECKDTSIGSSHLDGNGSHEHFDSDEVIDEPPLKRPELSPFADSSNPIFAQVAFLSAMVGSRVAALAAQAAVTALAEDDPVTHGLHTVNNHNQATSLKPEDAEGGDVHSGKERISAVSGAVTANAKTLADQEERDIEHILANMIEIQFKKLQSKVEHYEELEFILEKEKSQLEKAESQVLGDWIRYSHYHYSSGPS
ncbi:hypothetical protein KP509_28G011200 [Ceratopteris richardii]|nr:hypothetical protein KP509_28G011200 [Ceratopteris richardii]